MLTRTCVCKIVAKPLAPSCMNLLTLLSVMEAAKWLVAVLYICSASAQGKYKQWRGGVGSKFAGWRGDKAMHVVQSSPACKSPLYPPASYIKLENCLMSCQLPCQTDHIHKADNAWSTYMHDHPSKTDTLHVYRNLNQSLPLHLFQTNTYKKPPLGLFPQTFKHIYKNDRDGSQEWAVGGVSRITQICQGP